ncbi:MAG: Clp protease N-terminal domain-containing protein [Nostoc sp.]
MSPRFHLRGFERFTQKAVTAISIAQGESRRLGHQYIGTEQILLGLLGEGSSLESQFLTSVGVNLENAQIEVEKIIGRGKGNTPLDIPFTPRAKQVLELSVEQSRQLGVNYVDTEHLLLGILCESATGRGEGVAIKILQNLGVDVVSLEQRLRKALNSDNQRFSPE